VHLAERIPSIGPVARWSDLGAYRLVTILAESRDVESLVPGALSGLAHAEDAEALLPTLEAYLEHAGDAKATAKALFIHRSTLYQRLRRIEERAGVDLRAGDVRLELHLGLRLRHIANASRSEPTS
jgi:DNA-binding PucR family transcriptional regulator